MIGSPSSDHRRRAHRPGRNAEIDELAFNLVARGHAGCLRLRFVMLAVRCPTDLERIAIWR